jgi:hypothetical protein
MWIWIWVWMTERGCLEKRKYQQPAKTVDGERNRNTSNCYVFGSPAHSVKCACRVRKRLTFDRARRADLCPKIGLFLFLIPHGLIIKFSVK